MRTMTMAKLRIVAEAQAASIIGVLQTVEQCDSLTERLRAPADLSPSEKRIWKELLIQSLQR